MEPRDPNELNLGGRDYRKAFGQFSSNKTQRILTSHEEGRREPLSVS
jgi:hypothetical protein